MYRIDQEPERRHQAVRFVFGHDAFEIRKYVESCQWDLYKDHIYYSVVCVSPFLSPSDIPNK